MSNSAPNTEAALGFLQEFSSEGPWSLTAISPDRKTIDTRSFAPSEIEVCRRWIDERNGTQNLYFSINKVREGLQKKASKEDITKVEWLHVDIDPRAGEPISEERARILNLLAMNRPTDVPEPTVIIDSGGGYWGLWRLESPREITGTKDIDEMESFNQGLEMVFNADSCHNIDRIARPGTLNIPDAGKLAKGRLPSTAKVVSFQLALSYELAMFEPAPTLQQSISSAPTGQVVISAAPRSLTSIDALDDWHVDERVKIICVQGRHPDEPAKPQDDSRSAWLFDAVCNLVRAKVPDEIIFAVITDPHFRISESVVDKGRNARAYAVRQIERAKEEVIDPELRKMNEKHAVIQNWGGKCRIATFGQDRTDGRTIITMQTFQDIRDAYSNRFVNEQLATGKLISVPVGKWWLAHPLRRQYREIVFDPSGNVDADQLNLWTGFAIEPKEGDWSLMRAHIIDVIAKGNEKWADYIIRWVAWAVQNPSRQAEVALVLIGGKGSGKGTFGNALCDIFGQHALHIYSVDQLAGHFNAHLRDVCLLFADEAYWPGNKSAEGTLKGMIPEPTLTIEQKGVDTISSPNRLHIVMASNEDWVVPASTDERRFAVFELSTHRAGDFSYFADLRRQMHEHGGLPAMLHDLLKLNLGNWHPRQQVPRTDALASQQAEHLPPLEKFWFDCLVTGELPFFAEVSSDEVFVATSRISTLLTHGQRQVTSAKVAEFLGRGRGTKKGMGFVKDDSSRPRGFRIPPLAEARQAWNRHRFVFEWPEVDGWSSEGGNVQPHPEYDSPF